MYYFIPMSIEYVYLLIHFQKCHFQIFSEMIIWIILTLLEKILILALSRMTLSKMTLLKVYEKIDILLEIDIKEICMFDVCELSS